MSYLVFARKWRPQTFEDVVGQEHVTTTLKNAIIQNRVAHAYLFSGPRGVGKTTTARIFAKALNCQSGDKPNPTPCNKCESCIEITEGRSLDVIEIDGASNRGIDEIRQLRENVKFGPSKGRCKVYIIDEVHQITQDGFNALLKTLEEPPAHIKFVFATTHRHKVIPTILSRCQRFDFKRVPTLQLVEKLKAVAKNERVNIDEDALFVIARAADGSVRDAESILDQLVSFSHKHINTEDVVLLLGSIEQETLFEIARLIIEKDTQQAIKLVNKFINNGKDPLQFIDALIEHFRNLAVAKIESSPGDLIDLSKDTVDKIVKQSQRFNLAEILYIFNMLNSAQDLMRKSGLPRIQLEILLVKLTNRDLTRGAAGGKAILDTAGVAVTRSPERPRAVSEKTPKDTGFSGFKPDTDIKYADTGVGTFVQEAPLAEDNVSIAVQERLVSNSDIPAKDIISGSVNIDEIRNLWPELLSRIKSEKISAALFLLEGKPDFMDGFTLNINFPEQFVFYKEALERTENRNIIEKYLKEIFNKELKIKLNIVDTAPETIDKHVSSQPDVDAAVTHTDSKKEIISNNSHKNIDNVNKDNAMPEPIVKAALDIFKGRVVRK